MRLSSGRLSGRPVCWRRSSSSRVARPWACAAVLLCLAPFVGGASASADSLARSVRVLVYDQAEPVHVGSVDGPSKVRLDERGALLVEGRPVSGTWTPPSLSQSLPGTQDRRRTRPDSLPVWKVGTRTYRGEIRMRASEGRIQVLNRVGLDDYVASILGSEMSPSWPAEALRAQAVASRTYALYHAQRRQNEPWDVQATVASQVYRGISAESPETRSATEATSGQILTFQDAPILAVFHSTAGGRTATAEEVWGEDHPYLRSVEIEEADAPHTYWRTRFEGDDLESILGAAGLSSVGTVRALSVSSRTDSGRAETLRIEGTRGVETLQGDVLQSLLGVLGLRSKLFEVRKLESGFAFVGSGYGHGVGMSQWGARVMAERGDAYQRILARFYPGARLERRPEAFFAAHGQSGPGALFTRSGPSVTRSGPPVTRSGPPVTSGPQAQGDPK